MTPPSLRIVQKLAQQAVAFSFAMALRFRRGHGGTWPEVAHHTRPHRPRKEVGHGRISKASKAASFAGLSLEVFYHYIVLLRLYYTTCFRLGWHTGGISLFASHCTATNIKMLFAKIYYMFFLVENQPYQAEVETFGSRAAWKKWEEWEEGGCWVRFIGASFSGNRVKPGKAAHFFSGSSGGVEAWQTRRLAGDNSKSLFFLWGDRNESALRSDGHWADGCVEVRTSDVEYGEEFIDD